MLSEFRRLFYNKKVLLILLGLVALNAVLFVRSQLEYDAYSDILERTALYDAIYADIDGMSYDEVCEYLTVRNEAAADLEQGIINVVLNHAEYINTYDSYVDGVIGDAERVLSFSIFSADNSSYSTQNVAKTVAAYSRVSSGNLQLGNYTFLEYFMYYNTFLYIDIIMLLIIVMTVTREQKDGLAQMIYSSSGGRLRLAAGRFGFIAVSSFIIGAANMLITLFISISLYGGEFNPRAAIQSVELFKNFTYNVSIAGFLVRYYLITTLALIIISVFIWAFMSIIKNVVLSLLCILIIMYAEYGFVGRLTMQSNLKLLKCINFIEFINASDYCVKYYNISLFGSAVNQLLLIKLAMLAVFIILLVVGVVAFLKRPSISLPSVGLVDIILKKFRKILYKFKEIYNLTLAEIYKTLIINKGIIVAAVAVFALVNLIVVRNMQYTDVEEYVNEFYEEYSGTVDDTVYEHVASEHERAEQIYADYADALEKYENGEIDSDELYAYEYRLKFASIINDGLIIIEDEIARLEEVNSSLGIDAQLVNNRAYNKLLGSDGYATQRTIIVICLAFIVLTASGSFKYEDKSGMTYLMRSTAGGRNRVFRAKEVCVAGVTALVVLIIYIINFVFTANQYGMNGLSAPIQSIALFNSVPLKINILTYIVGAMLLRLVIYILIAEILLYISTVAEQKITVIVFTCVIIIPVLLGRINSDVFDRISYFELINLNGICTDGSNIIINLVKAVLLIIVFIIIRNHAFKKWCGRKVA